MCRNQCPSIANMTPVQLLEFTYARFKISILSLMIMVSAFLFYNVFHNTVSLPVLGYMLVYIIVLNIGMRGATNRNIHMLRFYWVFQLVQVLVLLLSLLALIVMSTIFHVQYYRAMSAEPRATHHAVLNNNVDLPKTTSLPGQKSDGAHVDVLIATQQGESTTTTVQTHQIMDEPVHHFSVVPLILPALIFLTIVFSVTRSIVLARQLIMFIEATQHLTTDIELDNKCCEEPETAKAAPESVYSPQAVYVMPASEGAYPGELMPVYVQTH